MPAGEAGVGEGVGEGEGVGVPDPRSRRSDELCETRGAWVTERAPMEGRGSESEGRSIGEDCGGTVEEGVGPEVPVLVGVGEGVGEEVDEGDSTRVDEKEIVGVLLGVPLGVSLKLLEEDRLGVILGVREVLGVPLGDEPCDGVALGVFDRVEEVEGVGWLVFVKELGILFVTVPVGVAVGLGVAVVVVVGEKEGVPVS